MEDPWLLSDRFERALRLAAEGHRDQRRRGNDVPYVAHPTAVAWIVERAGFEEATVIAALLHDLVEDTSISLDQIRDQFGAQVAATVAGCSEIKLDPAGRIRSWEDRKRDHLAALHTASLATRAVVLADKLHNLMSIRLDLDQGRAVWATFHASRDRVLWYHKAVIACCAMDDSRIAAIVRACERELAQIIELGGEKSDSPAATT